MQDYKRIKVWQAGYGLVLDVYRLTDLFPKSEIYSLTSQLRRAAVSIPSNIAEGTAKESDIDFARFLDIALGSTFEIECQLMIAQKLDYMCIDIFDNLYSRVDEIKKMLSSLIRSVRDAQLKT